MEETVKVIIRIKPLGLDENLKSLQGCIEVPIGPTTNRQTLIISAPPGIRFLKIQFIISNSSQSYILYFIFFLKKRNSFVGCIVSQ
jgi:hypothetical protein